MTKRDKLIEKIKARPAEASFADVHALMKDFGWRIDREKGSHVVFVKDGERPITIPKVGGRMVKGIYLDKICIHLGLDD